MLMEPCAQFGPVEFRVLSFGSCRIVVWACNTALSRAALSFLLLSMSFPQMLLRATMSSRADSKDSVHKRDCYFIFDNGLHHNEATMLRCFQNELGEHIDKKVFRVYVGHDEDSVKKRKQLVRDTGVFEGVEYLNLITSDAFPSIPYIQRAVFKGSNRNNFLGDLTTPAISNLWHLTAQEKHECHGTFRVQADGQAADAAAGGSKVGSRGAEKRKADSMEPAFWHSRDPKVYHEMRVSYCLCAVIDFSMGSGDFALECAKSRVPYHGFALGEKHASLVKKRIVQEMLGRCGAGCGLF